tara:strand:- start:363 stop:1202 length:840 start_codon:yes stop_codon:yes gene_type:complete
MDMMLRIVKLIWRSIRRWVQHDGPGLAASVSFYALFAMAPLLVFGVVVTSRTLGPEKAKASAVEWLSDMIPVDAAESLISVMHVKILADGPWWSNVVSALVLIWASSLIFVRLLLGTRVMFDQKYETPRALFFKSLIGRLIALAFAIVVGLLICLVFIVPTLAAPWMSDWKFAEGLAGVSNALLLTLGGLVLLRVVPSPAPRKRALFSASLFFLIAFFIGRTLFQTYISHSPIASAYGVASSVVIFLVWIYYMSSGYFIGAALCAEIANEVPRSRPGED